MSNSSFEFQDIETKVEKNIDNATSEHWKKKTHERVAVA